MYYPVQTPWFFKRLFPEVIWALPPKPGKCLYLSFDDGPIPEITPWVLEQLKNYDAKATFFCVGANVKKNPAIYQSILEQGHVVGNHTYHHCNGWKTATNNYLEEVQKCRQIVDSNLFRPPYGRLRPRQYHLLKHSYKLIMWDIIAGDFDPNISFQECLDNVVNNAKDGSIVVLHDSLKSKQKLFKVLPLILQYFHRRSYSFEPIVLP